MTRAGVFAPLATALCASLAFASSAAAAPPFTRIDDGFGFESNIRPALADDGTVVAAGATQLHVGDGGPVTLIDLAPSSLQLVPGGQGVRAVQVRSAGDVVFVADRSGVAGCGPMPARGVYRTDTLGAAPATLFEACVMVPGEEVGPHVSLSDGGTVAFSTIVSSQGAVRRGPIAGPLAVVRSGSGTFFNTREVVVNDAGQTAVQMEYTDPFAGLVRAVFVFDDPEPALLDTDTAVERISVQPFIGMNSDGVVALTFNNNFTMTIDGTPYSFDAGVYTAEPTAFNTQKMLTQVADMSGDYCGFGRVDINDSGEVVFEAQVAGGLAGCAGTFGSWDGIYKGPDPSADALVAFGDAALEEHQFYDSVVLGELNDNNQVSFLTNYSEPLVPSQIVWRTEFTGSNPSNLQCTTLPSGERYCFAPRTCSAGPLGRGSLGASLVWLLVIASLTQWRRLRWRDDHRRSGASAGL